MWVSLGLAVLFLIVWGFYLIFRHTYTHMYNGKILPFCLIKFFFNLTNKVIKGMILKAAKNV